MKKVLFTLFIIIAFTINLRALNIGAPNPYIYNNILHLGVMDSGVGYKFLHKKLEVSAGINPLPFFLSSYGIKDFISFNSTGNFFIKRNFSIFGGIHYLSYKGEDYLKDNLNEKLKDIIVIKDLELNFNAFEVYAGVMKRFSFMDLWGYISYISFKPEHYNHENSVKFGIGSKKDFRLLFYKAISYLTLNYDTNTANFIATFSLDNKFSNMIGLKIGVIYPGLSVNVGKKIDIPVLPVIDLYVELLKF